MRRRRPKLLCEVLKSNNVICMLNYDVINSYLPFSFFHFSMTTLLQLGVYAEGTVKAKIFSQKNTRLLLLLFTTCKLLLR